MITEHINGREGGRVKFNSESGFFFFFLCACILDGRGVRGMVKGRRNV